MAVVQLMGLDANFRSEIGSTLAGRTNSWHIKDTEIPMATIPEQWARWLRSISYLHQSKVDLHIIADAYFPTKEARREFQSGLPQFIPSLRVWVDTIDTPELREQFKWEDITESEYDIRITKTNNSEIDTGNHWATIITNKLNLLDWKKPSVLMVGDFQNWGKQDIERYNKLKSENNSQVVIGIRHTKGNQPGFNTFYSDIKEKIIKDIPDAYVIKLPNIVEVDKP